jgi:hypothetical protein
VCALPRLALRTCAVQRLLSARRAWQILWGSCALVENKAHRLLECLTDSHTLLGVLRRDCWCGRCSYHHSARQYYHHGRDVMGSLSVLPPTSKSAETSDADLEVSASFLSERLDCHAGALFRSVSLTCRLSSRRLGVAGLASHY